MQILRGHTDRVRCLAYSPDGALLASGGNDQTIRLWDWQGGRELMTLRRRKKYVYGLAFSPDGEQLASCGADRAVTLWDLRRGEVIRVLKGHTQVVSSLAFAADGRLASTAGDWTGFNPRGEAIIWDLETGQPDASLSAEEGGVLSLAWSPDDQTLALGTGDGFVLVWDPRIPPHRARFSTDHRMTRLGPWPTNAPRPSTEEEGRSNIKPLFNKAKPLGVAYMPDGRTVAAVSGWAVKLWDLAGLRVRATLRGHGDRIMALALSPDGQFLATGGRDRLVWIRDLGALAQVFDSGFRLRGEIASDEALQYDGQIGPIDSLAFAPDGMTIAAGGERDIIIWDVAGVMA